MTNVDKLIASIMCVASSTHREPEWDALVGFLSMPEVSARLETAPASTAHRYHHADEGGLVNHIIEILRYGGAILQQVGKPVAPGVVSMPPGDHKVTQIRIVDFVLVAVLHDIHKIGDVMGNRRFEPNILASGKRSTAEPCKTASVVDCYEGCVNPDKPTTRALRVLLERNQRALAEGEYSIALVAGLDPKLFSLLNNDVLFAIRHHDGYYGGARRDLAGKETPLQIFIHFLDMWSSRVNGQIYRSNSGS